MAFSRPKPGPLTPLTALAALPLACAIAGACVPGTGPALDYDLDASPPPPDLDFGDAGLVRVDAALGDPFAISGLTPSHGPYIGGTRARIDGRGFSSQLRVFVGGVEVPPAGVLASDPTRAAIVTPPHAPGFVDVKIRDEATKTERTLQNGFFYDAIVATPDSGASSGGTRVSISGAEGTSWGPGTTVDIGGLPCGDVIVSTTKVECTTPAGTPGSKDIVVHPVAPDGTKGDDVQARDGFTYSDSADGYRGGLSGGAISGRVKVIAFDAALGTPIKNAFVIIGTDVSNPAKTAVNGVVEVPNLTTNKVTITVAARCHAPITYVDVPVDTLTVYMNPVLEPECLEGDPPTIPGASNTKVGGFVNGEVIFPGGTKEFERANWTTVPTPTKPTERKAAYAFEASSSPNGTFTLPPADQAITPESDGTGGYKYQLLTFPGNITMYVIAGLEDRSVDPPSFIPYAMGIARGISVPSQGTVDAVDLKMDILFDHEVKITANAPKPGPRGPDRLTASLALTLGAAGYAIIPRGTRVSPLPAPNEISFVGVPALDHGIANEQYVIGARAATSANDQPPISVVSRVRTTDANGSVSLGGFLEVPVISLPGASPWDGKHVSFTGSTDIADLSVITISGDNGLLSWTIVAPKGVHDFDVPDLSAVKSADPVGLRKGGVIGTTVSTARIDNFDYGRIRTGQLGANAWNAYAYDSISGIY